MKREKLHGTEAMPDALTDLIHADAAKALVVAYIGQLVVDGNAEWDVLENGHVQLRCHSGEIFLLAETMITRIA